MFQLWTLSQQFNIILIQSSLKLYKVSIVSLDLHKANSLNYLSIQSIIKLVYYKITWWDALAKFRCGVAPIRNEVGQYENVKEENRLCLLCNDNAIENEEHIILKCCAYNDIQTDLFTSATSTHPNFDNLVDDDKLSLILANADMVSNSAKTCHQILSKWRLLMYR